MLRHTCLSLLLALLFVSPTFAEKVSEPSAQSWLKGMLAKVVEVTNKHVKKDDDVPVAVAGLRGENQKNETMEPYWKGDLTANSADYKSYRQIEQAMQDGRYPDALRLISEFNKKYIKSKLMPEVQFTLALAYTGTGDHKKAVEAFEGLIKMYPRHELVGASKDGISRLKKA